MTLHPLPNTIFTQVDHMKSYDGDQSVLGTADVFLLQLIDIDELVD